MEETLKNRFYVAARETNDGYHLYSVLDSYREVNIDKKFNNDVVFDCYNELMAHVICAALNDRYHLDAPDAIIYDVYLW